MCCASKDNPKVSVIVPVYNVQAYLRECLDSLKNQTYTNLEILVVDDGSTDGCGKICDEYATQDSRFRVFHTENNGLSGARNYGLNFVSGEFVGFVDSDDKCELTMYESLVHAAIKHRADITFGARSTWFANCVKQDKHPVKNDMAISRNNFMKAIFGQGEWRSTSVAGGYVWLKLFKRQTIEGLKFVDTKVCLEDE